MYCCRRVVLLLVGLLLGSTSEKAQTDWSEITRLLRFSHLVHTWLRHPSLLLSLLLLLLLPLVRMEIALRLLDLVTGSQDLDQAFRNWAALTS